MVSSNFVRPHKPLMAIEKFFLVLTALTFIWSLIRPYDFLTWVLEVAPALIGFSLIAFYWKRFRLSSFLLILICIHSLILIIGGHYTYARVPAGFWVQEWFGLSRNHYDRLGHFIQGFEPAFLARELLLRNRVIKKGGWLTLFIVSVCLGFSALYELIEFAGAVLLGDSAESFLGTQGDVWDTQKDMLLALIGALCSLPLARWHDRSIAKVSGH